MKKLLTYIGWEDWLYGFIFGAVMGAGISLLMRPSPMEPFKQRPQGTTSVMTNDSVFYMAYIIYGQGELGKSHSVPAPPPITP